MTFSSCTITGNTAFYSNVRAHAQISHRPDGIFTCFARVLAGRRCLCPEWLGDLLIVHHQWQHSYLRACSSSKLPIAPMGKLLTCLLRLTLCTTGNASVNYRGCVPQRPSKVPIAPMGKCPVDMSNSILIFYDGCCLDLPGWSTCHLRLKLQKFPSPRWDFHMSPCFVLPGRRCLCREWHGDLLIVHHHWQLSSICACSCSKVPITPMGKLLTCLP